MTLNDVCHISSGLFVSKDKNWVHPNRCIDSYEIIFSLSGTFSIKESEKIYTLCEGDILLLNKQTDHCGIKTMSGDPVSFYWVHFDQLPSNMLLPKHMKAVTPTNLVVLFKQLLHYNYSSRYPSFTADFVLRLVLTEINVQYVNTCRENITLINKICEWIRINIDKDITIMDISSEFGYNKDYLTHLMKSANLPGLKQLIIQAKCDKIRYLLLTTELPLKDISLQTGFQDTNAFLKFFKRHEGVTPSDFRNIYSKTHLNQK